MGACVLLTQLFEKADGRLNRQIPLVGRDKAKITGSGHPALGVEDNMYIIPECDGLHDHQHIMVAVGAAVHHVKGYIKLCIGLFSYLFHGSSSYKYTLSS